MPCNSPGHDYGFYFALPAGCSAGIVDKATTYNCKIQWLVADAKGCRFSWTDTLPSTDPKAIAKSTVPNCTEDIIGQPLPYTPAFTDPSPVGWNPEHSRDIEIEESCFRHVACRCEAKKEDIDPVFAKANLFFGIGIGFNRSLTVLCHTDDMDSSSGSIVGNCPERKIQYHLHVNRLTERYQTSRSTK